MRSAVQPARDAQTVDEPIGDPSRAADPAPLPADSAAVPAPRPAPEAAPHPVPRQPGAGDPVHREAPEPTIRPDESPDNEPPAPGDEAAGDAPPGEPAPAPTGPALTEREREILAFEQKWWKHAGAKEQAIRDAFDLSATRYYQLLNALLDNPAALAAAPMLVARLRRLRAARTRTRRR